jgi:hypothetical protein
MSKAGRATEVRGLRLCFQLLDGILENGIGSASSTKPPKNPPTVITAGQSSSYLRREIAGSFTHNHVNCCRCHAQATRLNPFPPTLLGLGWPVGADPYRCEMWAYLVHSVLYSHC